MDEGLWEITQHLEAGSRFFAHQADIVAVCQHSLENVFRAGKFIAHDPILCDPQ